MTSSTPDLPVSFETDVKPLFRATDRQSMRLHFDLWSYEDVKDHSDRILTRLRAGTMPCDGAWTPEQVQVVERWMRTGMRP